jgi:GNAT superfamily N-acetyltransferase
MLISEIQSIEECADEEIRARAKVSPKAPRTRHYRAIENGSEIAFLSLDFIPDVDYLVLYELFVPTALRRQGVGSRLLAEVEKMAAGLAYVQVNLTPWPLDDSMSEETLVHWYKVRGYDERPDCSDELQKILGHGFSSSIGTSAKE